MDAVKAATVGAVAVCATLMLLTTTRHGHAEPPAMRAPDDLSSGRSAADVVAATPMVHLPRTTSPSGEADQAGPPPDVRSHGASPSRRPRFDADSVASWEALIAEASQRFGVPASWVRGVMQVESSGRTTLNGRPITSPGGAMGLMQVMPGTFAEMARRYGLGSDPYDPRANILAGTAFLREMYDRFGVDHFLAAYNAGPGRVEDHLRTGRPLSDETRRYVQALAPRLVGGERSDDPATAMEVRDLTSLQALRDAALFPYRDASSLRPIPQAASVFVASNDRSFASDRQLGERTSDALFVHLTREDQRRAATITDRPEN